jgi:hypothetical protein
MSAATRSDAKCLHEAAEASDPLSMPYPTSLSIEKEDLERAGEQRRRVELI